MAKILTEGFFDEPVCSMNNSCNAEPCKVYKFNFIIQFPGGFEEEILDSCKACSEEEASDIFGKTYDLSGGKVVIDPTYEEEFNVALESMKKKSLKEDYDPSIPEWVKKAIKSDIWRDHRRNAKLGRIAWDKAKYISDEVPTSNRDPRLKDPNRLNLFKFKNGSSDAFYKGDFIQDLWINWRPISKTPWKNIIPHIDEFGYIDLTDSNNSNADVRSDRREIKKDSVLDPDSPNYRGQGQYHHRSDRYDYKTGESWVDYEWIMTSGQDKSGYKLDPYRLQRKLDNIGFKEVSSRIESFYNQLESVRLQLINLLSSLDVKNMTLAKNTNYTTNADVVSQTARYFSNAADTFRQIKTEVDKTVDDLKSGRISKATADSQINYTFKYLAKDFRNYLKDAKESLDRL